MSIGARWKHIVRSGAAVVLGIALLIPFLPGTAAAADQPKIKVFVDVTEVDFAVEPLIVNGTTLVQFRPLFQSMKMEVGWDAEQRVVTGHKEGLDIRIGIDERQASVNGSPVELSESARIVNDSTMVPLRFIGESTGALVHWDEPNREITIVTEELWAALGMTKAEMKAKLDALNPAAAAPPAEVPAQPAQPQEPPASVPAQPAHPLQLDQLQGMYYNIRNDMGGYECGGSCWDMYTFLPGGKIFVGLPPAGGPETLDCSKDACTTYTIKGDQLVLGTGESYSVKVENGELKLNGYGMTAVTPVPAGLKLKGTYQHIGYQGLVGIHFSSSSWREYLEFKEDGTFTSTDLTLAALDSAISSVHSTGSDSSEGTYSISGNTITLTFKDGTVRSTVFFVHFGDITDVQIGSSNFYIDDDE